MLAPSVLNFLAGLFAAVGINMLTSVAVGPVETSTAAIAIDAGVWVLAAAATTWLAQMTEVVRRDVERRVTESFTEEEIAGVRSLARAQVAAKLNTATVAAISMVLLGVLLLPNLLPLPR